MAANPAAVGGKVRVVRIHKHVTEALIDTTVYTTPAAQVAAAKALRPTDWYTRPVLPDGGADAFEYDVVASDGV